MRLLALALLAACGGGAAPAAPLVFDSLAAGDAVIGVVDVGPDFAAVVMHDRIEVYANTPRTFAVVFADLSWRGDVGSGAADNRGFFEFSSATQEVELAPSFAYGPDFVSIPLSLFRGTHVAWTLNTAGPVQFPLHFAAIP